MSVPNEFPAVEMPYRLAVVGEAPGTHEVLQGRPFVGPSGQLLNGALQNAGVMRSACFVGNVCQEQPPDNNIEAFDKNGPEIQEGLLRLRNDLNNFNPHCVLVLGKTALWATGVLHSITEFRGSIFSASLNGVGGASSSQASARRYKCVAAYHPAAVLRMWEWRPFFMFDVARAAQESQTPDLVLPQRRLLIDLTPPEIISRLQAIKPGTLVSLDIEGGVPNPTAKEVKYRFFDGVTCVSISTDPLEAFIIPIVDYDKPTKTAVMREFAKVMANPDIPKLLQNSLYDFSVLAHVWKIPVRGIAHDTMLSGWEIYPELPKGLGTQASIWTREPAYKFERQIEDKRVHYTYCCKDSAITLEIHQNHLKAMTPSARAHYDLNMSLIPALQYMSLRGIRYDREGAQQKLEEIKVGQLEYQTACNTHAGKPINMNSPPQMCNLLYKHFMLEPQYKVEKGRKTNKLTADKKTLLKLYTKTNHPFLATALGWRKLEGQRKQLCIEPDKDGRMRCSYNLVGTETGRLSCSEAVTGSGTNLQTIIKGLRKLYVADPGHYFFQCDLSGADGWTVAARCLEYGDPTMMDDYLAGIKPAKVIACMQHVGAHISSLPRDELKALIKRTDLPRSLYDACKAVQHGSNYMMGANTMSDNILDKSFTHSSEFNILYVPPRECTALQALYFRRYPGVKHWHEGLSKKILSSCQLSSASGHTRTFFARPGDRETTKEALAHEPQANTTYVTNVALRNLWFDPENRRDDNSLIIEPLHSVHDALCGQFPKERVDWAVEKIRSYFQIPIRVANSTFIIPFEGGYGPSWYETDEDHRIGVI